MAKVSIIIEDVDAKNTVVTLEGDYGNPLSKDSPPPTNAQRVAWDALHFLTTQAGSKSEKARVEEQEPKG